MLQINQSMINKMPPISDTFLEATHDLRIFADLPTNQSLLISNIIQKHSDEMNLIMVV